MVEYITLNTRIDMLATLLFLGTIGLLVSMGLYLYLDIKRSREGEELLYDVAEEYENRIG